MGKLSKRKKWNIYYKACDWIRPTIDDVLNIKYFYNTNSFVEKYKISEDDANKLIEKLVSDGKLVKTKDEGIYEAVRICSICGKKFDEFDCQENHYIHNYFGYGSKYDLHELEVDLCACCYDNIVDIILSKAKKNVMKKYDSINEEPF